MVNKVILIGNVGQDPEVKTLEWGKVASFSLATTETWKDKQGEKQSETQWHNVKVSGKLADIVESYVKKGSKLYLEGSVKYRSWDKDDGTKGYATEINCRNLTMLGSQDSTQQNNVQPSSDEDTNDLPF